MEQLEQEFNKLFETVYSNSIRRKRKCFVENCSLEAISSHLLQKNGLLSQISDKDKNLYQVKLFRYPIAKYVVKKVSANKALTFKGFCNNHDSELFKSIEDKNEIDFNDYNTQLLFSYRSVLKEYRDKEALVEFFREMFLKSISIILLKPYSELFYNSLRAEISAQNTVGFIVKSIQKNLNNIKENQFHFNVFELPKLEICASAIYSLESVGETNRRLQLSDLEVKHLPCLIINIIPQKTKTILLIGYHTLSKDLCEKVVKEYYEFDEKGLVKLVSDMLIRNFETWAFSSNIYEKKIKKREDIFLDLMNNYIGKMQFSNEKIDFNIFE